MDIGVLQSNNWISRGLGTLFGALFGGMGYQYLGYDAVFTITSAMPFLMSILIWKLPKSKKRVPFSMSSLYNNFSEERELGLLLFFITAAPSYGTFYTYFLRDELKYSALDFTWLSMGSSLSFLFGVVSYRVYFRRLGYKRVLRGAVLVATVCRITQLFVLLKIFTNFWVVVLDGVAESFCGQLLMMPLIVYTADRCNEGVEGTLFALMMSISNISNSLSEGMGAAVAALFGVTENNFSNLFYVMLICILLDFLIPIWAIKKMFFVSSEREIDLEELTMIELDFDRVDQVDRDDLDDLDDLDDFARVDRVEL